MSGYCPAGKCECEKYDNEYCHYGRTPLAPIVFGVCPYFSERQQDAKLKEARTAGRLAGLREAREAVVEKLDKLAEQMEYGALLKDGEIYQNELIQKYDQKALSAAERIILAAIDRLMES